jgi:hypothetical protein
MPQVTFYFSLEIISGSFDAKIRWNIPLIFLKQINDYFNQHFFVDRVALSQHQG